jgi:hypothetical protein
MQWVFAKQERFEFLLDNDLRTGQGTTRRARLAYANQASVCLDLH